MKSMRPPLVAIFFMTYFHRAGGPWPPRPPLDPLLRQPETETETVLAAGGLVISLKKKRLQFNTPNPNQHVDRIFLKSTPCCRDFNACAGDHTALAENPRGIAPLETEPPHLPGRLAAW